MESFFSKISNEVWGKWCSVPIFIAASIIIGIPSCTAIADCFSVNISENNVTYSKTNTIGFVLILILILGFLIFNLWNLVFVILKNRIRKPRKGKTGILIRFDATEKNIYEEAKRKFGEEFQNNVYKNFDVIYVPFGKKIVDYKDKSAMRKYLRKRQCVLLLNIGINTDTDDKIIHYDMKLNATIIHLTYKEKVEQEFQKAFSFALKNFRQVEFESKDMIKTLRVTAVDMSLACEYVIGLSLFLNGDFIAAENVLAPLADKLSNNSKWVQMTIAIRRMRYEMFMTISIVYMEQYQRMCDDKELLILMNQYLEKANACIKETYEYCLNKAYCYIAMEKDSVNARKMINLCKQKGGSKKEWKYSSAFLDAYDNRAVGSILTSYKQALVVDYNIQDLIVYIEFVHNNEPERNGLNLALGILYKKTGDEKLSNEYFDQYLANVNDRQKTKECLVRRGYL